MFYGDWGLYALQVAVAVIFIYHGLPKIKKARAMAQGMGMPAGAVMLLGAVELLSGIDLLLGVQIQLASALLVLVMLGALYFKIKKWRVPFSTMSATGWEFDLILLAAAIAILTTGGVTIGFL